MKILRRLRSIFHRPDVLYVHGKWPFFVLEKNRNNKERVYARQQWPRCLRNKGASAALLLVYSLCPLVLFIYLFSKWENTIRRQQSHMY